MPWQREDAWLPRGVGCALASGETEEEPTIPQVSRVLTCVGEPWSELSVVQMPPLCAAPELFLQHLCADFHIEKEMGFSKERMFAEPGGLCTPTSGGPGRHTGHQGPSDHWNGAYPPTDMSLALFWQQKPEPAGLAEDITISSWIRRLCKAQLVQCPGGSKGSWPLLSPAPLPRTMHCVC